MASKVIRIGDKVQFDGDLEALLAGLPAQETQSIRKVLHTTPFRLTEMKDGGIAEIELAVETGLFHFFYVSANKLSLSNKR